MPSPARQVYVAPHQWSFPLNLPVQLFGIFPAGTLEEGGQYPWGDELDFRIFSANLAQGAAPGHSVNHTIVGLAHTYFTQHASWLVLL